MFKYLGNNYYNFSLPVTTSNTQRESKLNSQINYNEIEFGKELGRGAFGIVFRAKWRLIDVAVKKLLTNQLTEKQINEFLSEASVMSSIKPHKNIVQLYGISTAPDGPICIGKFHFQYFKV